MNPYNSLSGIGPTGSNQGFSRSGNASQQLTGNKIPKGYSQGTLQQFTPEQMQLFQQMFGNVGPDSFLSKLAGGDENTFNQIEAPAMRQFQGLQGNIASRFSGMGTGGRKSSGFQNTLSAAGSNFAQDLQSQRQSLQQQALKDLMGMSESLLNQRPQENFLVQKQHKPSFMDKWLGLAGNVLGGAARGGAGGIGGF